jgi:Gluconate 2-dehydrogenase subunit 3
VSASDARAGRAGISRGAFLKRAGAAGVATTVSAGLLGREAPPAAAAPTERAALETLTPAQADVLDAILDRLAPSDSLGPGAVQMGVGTYIDRALGGALAANAPAYNVGLATVDAFARATYGSAFAQLTTAQKDAVITSMQANTLPWPPAPAPPALPTTPAPPNIQPPTVPLPPDSRTFFNLVREHLLQGMFGDPYYGGNKNGAGWKLIRFPGISLDVKRFDQRVNVTRYRSQYKRSAYDWDLFKRQK